VGVELSATAVEWPALLASIEEKPGRYRRAGFLLKALEKGEPWLEDLSNSIDPTDGTMIQTAQAYDRVRDLITPESREPFDRFAGAFFWILTENSPYDEPPVRDLGPKSDPQLLFSSFSPESVSSYLATWKALDLDLLKGAFEAGLGHRAYRGSKARNGSIFEGRFRPYFTQWGDLLERAGTKGRGLIISFL
jgi:hypothetical protein